MIDRYGISVSQITTHVFRLSSSQPALSSFMIYHLICNESNMTGSTSEAGTVHPSSTPVFSGVCVAQSFSVL